MTAQAEARLPITEEDTEQLVARLRELLPAARKAYGSSQPWSLERKSSDEVNRLLLDYKDRGGNLAELGRRLGDDLSLSAIRRRVRFAKGAELGAEAGQAPLGTRMPIRSYNPENIKTAAEIVAVARQTGGAEYGKAVRGIYDAGIPLQPVADMLGISYFSLWAAKRSTY